MSAARWKQFVAGVCAVIAAAFGITIVIDFGDDGDNRPNQITITLPSTPPAAVQTGRVEEPETAEVTAPKAALQQAAVSDIGDHQDQGDETPPGAPADQLEAARAQQERIQQTDPLPLSYPLAATSYTGCRNRFVKNQSSRNGVTPQQIWVHYTVSPNRPGLSDVNAITMLFDRLSFGASSHFVIDADGNCNYIVPTYRKAWTQAAANPIAISFEIINTGREGHLMRAAGYKQIGRTIARLSKQFGIPIQRGRVSGCRSLRKGIVMHKDGGQCAGGHVDVTPYSLEPVIAAAKAAGGGGKPVTRADRSTCAKINWWRRHGRPKGEATANAVRRRQALAKRRVVCTRRGPARRR